MKKVVIFVLRWLLRRLERREHPPPDPTELQENVVHIAFEMAAMESAAYLEEVLLHVRLMREFLWGRGDRGGRGAENSLLAEHYFPDASNWREIKGGLPPTLKATEDRINRQLFHLSRDRAGHFMDLAPKVPEMRREIEAQWNRFEDTLSDRWATAFRTALDEKRTEMNSR